MFLVIMLVVTVYLSNCPKACSDCVSSMFLVLMLIVAVYLVCF